MAAVEVINPSSGDLIRAQLGDLSPHVFFNEANGSLTAAQTVTGASRDAGVAAGVMGRFNTFAAMAISNVAGTMRIESSLNGTVWTAATDDYALTPGSVLTVAVPCMARFHRVVYINGASPASGAVINSSYSSAPAPASASGVIHVVPSPPWSPMAPIITVQTAANGTSFAAFPSQSCTALDIINNTGFAIEIQLGGSGPAITLLTGQSRMMIGINNANQIGVRRADQSSAQLTVVAQAFTVA